MNSKLPTRSSKAPAFQRISSLLMLAGLAAAATLSSPASAQVQPHGSMMRFPDISKSHIVFAYANDLWVAPKSGGVAQILASPPGGEAFPRFSADGQTIAFVGNYEGNRDIYTLPLSGGIPTRVTYHPAAETLCDWTGPGFEGGDQLAFFMSGLAGLGRQTQIFTVPATGGLASQLPVPYSGFGAISPDGTWLAYTPHSIDTRTWKRYRGGMATDVWLFNIKDKTSRKITDWEGTDTIPMWIPGGNGNVVYYHSDNGPEHRMNIWAFNVKDGTREQITKYTDNDVKWPSIGPGDNGEGEIIFQLGAELKVVNLGTRADRTVTVTIPGDRPTIKPRMEDASQLIRSASISPSGKRVAVQARGDIFTAPAKEGITRNLTRTDGTFERDPSWSPDGRWIAYFSDESGEYELWLRPSDGRAPEPKKDDKKSEDKKSEDKKPDDNKSDDASKDEEKKPAEDANADASEANAKDAAKADAKDDAKPAVTTEKAAPRKLTSIGTGFKFNITWSPDSKFICFTDNIGRLFLTTVESGETKEIDQDPWGNPMGVNWSHDSQWITFARGEDHYNASNGIIFLYNAKTGTKTQVTSNMFASSSPTFDRKGDFLYFRSNRNISAPVYSDIDSTFAYNNTELLYMVPLRKDVKNPFAPKVDEEEFKPEEKKEDKKDDKKEDKKPDEAKKDEGDSKDKPAKEGKDDAKADDGVSGTWTGQVTGQGPNMPPGGVPVTLTIVLGSEGVVTGTASSVMGGGPISNGKYDKATGELSFSISVGRASVNISGKITGDEFKGSFNMGESAGTITAKRTSKTTDSASAKSETAEASKDVKIDLEGFERRAVQLPLVSGSFGNLAVSHDNKLIFARFSSKTSSEAGAIKIFDPADEAREEKVVQAGAGGFDISADGKKLLIFRGRSLTIADASAGGGKTSSVPTNSMMVSVNPRNEWRQIITDTWRLHRDYFYENTLHGVKWDNVRDHYLKLLEDAVSREDVAFLQSEMVSELNIGHAYISNPGDVESSVPSVNVGLLGCDYELVKSDAGTAYRISKIYSGADWDADARGPLDQLGVNVKEGDYLLAVNDVPIDTSKDPYAAFLGTANQVTSITVGTNPIIDDKSRQVLVTPTASESNLRYRAWIETKRAHADKASNGKIGYIYVPNTGVDGQSDLFRQFTGQRGKEALIIDDRWNGGGQIPTRFIELLNRPPTNFWARRGGKDWPWPSDAHFGPKAMLANGLAGSGGDMFPWLFKHNKIGKVIGTRTWGGLVGISGNPELIDGGVITVPTFGFYETDGTWGVEGHGVDPDIEVIDDPAKMVNGGDPQLDAAISHLLEEIKNNGFVPPKRPAGPNRSGMGLDPKDK